jgi:hypothetical protein
MEDNGAINELLDKMGAQTEEARKRVLDVLMALYRKDGVPYDQVVVLTGDEEERKMLPSVCAALGFKVVEFAPLAPLAQVKDFCEQFGKALYVIHLPMKSEVRIWVSIILDDPEAQTKYVWAVTGNDTELKRAGFPTDEK